MFNNNESVDSGLIGDKVLHKEITGIILSGGKSSRMGTDKALLRLGAETIIERMTNLIKSVFNKVIIVTNTPEDYSFLNIPLFEDIYKHKGPLSGIHSGLIHSKTEKNFIISCDIPLMSGEMIKYIVEYKSNKPVIFCSAVGRLHHLAGIYSRSIIPEIERTFSSVNLSSSVKEKHFSIMHLLKNVKSEIIYPENLPFYYDKLFFNLNNLEDFERLKGILS